MIEGMIEGQGRAEEGALPDEPSRWTFAPVNMCDGSESTNGTNVGVFCPHPKTKPAIFLRLKLNQQLHNLYLLWGCWINVRFLITAAGGFLSHGIQNLLFITNTSAGRPNPLGPLDTELIPVSMLQLTGKLYQILKHLHVFFVYFNQK